ncbi:Fruiting body protein SC1 [Psilocybe cubensis]|uniref:Fruiting body protein SC1 n=2 Tax=Psilocybe cubensis TaxID=181762 RepID=A0ACB8GUN3_PSICU|nr:Fruiting body protein SC1 [Psilocybe cubensis]KAH9479147.1 Fruiting body protein SC1 [Psilocybe cubensis]
MFARASTLVLALPLLAAATALPRTNGDGPSNQCNTGTISCCNQTLQSGTASTNLLLGLLGIVLGPVTGLLGLGCTPITVIGAGGNSCSAQPVCCTGNTFNGLINVGCTPINLNL